MTLQDVVFGESTLQWAIKHAAWSFGNSQPSEEIAKASTHGEGLRIALVDLAPEYYNITTPQENISLSLPWGHPSSSRYTEKDGSEYVPVSGMSAVCYYYAVEMTEKNKSIPVGVIASSWGGTRIQVWMDRPTLKSCGASGMSSSLDPSDTAFEVNPLFQSKLLKLGGGPPNLESTLWNSMISPLLKLKLTGILWYQGESNSQEPELYSRCFPAMINQWRQYWSAPSCRLCLFRFLHGQTITLALFPASATRR